MRQCEKTTRTCSNHDSRNVCKIKTLNFDSVHLYIDGIWSLVHFTLFGKITATSALVA